MPFLTKSLTVVALAALGNGLSVDEREDTFHLPNLIHKKSPQPGVVVGLTQYGLEFLSTFGVKLGEQALSNLNIPDFNFDQFKIEAHISNISCADITFGVMDTAISDNSLDFSTTNMNVECHLHWDAKTHFWPNLHGHGDIKAKLSKSDFKLSLEAFNGGFLHKAPQLKQKACEGSFNFDIDFGTGAIALLIGAFKDQATEFIGKHFKDVLCFGTQDLVIPKVNYLLRNITYDLNVPIFNESLAVNVNSRFDYEKNKVLKVGIDTGITTKGDQKKFIAHEKAVVIPEELVSSTGKHLVAASVDAAFLLETAYQIYADSDKLEIPVDEQVLTTKIFQFILPNLYELYPDKQMKLVVKAFDNLSTVFTDSANTLQVTADKIHVEFFVHATETSTVPVFSFELTKSMVLFAIDPTSTETLLNLKFLDFNLVASLIDSKIGNIDMDWLNNGLQFAHPVAVNGVNELLTQVKIPKIELQGVEFVLSNFSFKNGNLNIALDPK